jgi:hypothetical protein
MRYHMSTQTIAWFRDRYRDGSLQIKPPYQRKPVWAARQKCYLIESILMGLPVPEIYVQATTSPTGETNYAIVDGQQRIRAVLQFVGSETDPEEQEHNKFSLDKLDTGSPWRDGSFVGLTDSDKKKFFSYEFAVRNLKTDSDEEVRDMFRRINQFLTPLNAQELRNATYMGPFIQLALSFADDTYWAEHKIVSAASIRRSGDVQFVSELLIGVLHGPQGGSSAIIDEYYRQYEDYEEEFPEQEKSQTLFKRTLEALKRLIPDIKESRWSNKTDFYTLFVVIASLFKKKKTIIDGKLSKLRKTLEEFSEKVNDRLADEEAKVPKEVIRYIQAVEKGANDKTRRADRHKIVLSVIEEFFEAK